MNVDAKISHLANKNVFKCKTLVTQQLVQETNYVGGAIVSLPGYRI